MNVNVVLFILAAFVSLNIATNCTTYCNQANDYCTQVYDVQTCNLICKYYPLGNDNDTTGNSVSCRYNAVLAAKNQSNITMCNNIRYNANYCGSPCEAFCNYSTACVNYTSVFSSFDVCNQTCNLWNQTAGATTGNTVACRLNVFYGIISSSGITLSNLENSCPRISASGNGFCSNNGSNTQNSVCENYCDYSLQLCNTGTSQQYKDRDDCRRHCKLFPSTFVNATSGNSVECRIYHTINSLISGDKTHCIHGNSSGGAVCGTRCEVYCDLATRYCLGNNQLYTSTNSCLTACANFPFSDVEGSTAGNSVQCRTTYLQMAGMDPTTASTNCAIGGQLGGLFCTFGNGTGTTGGSTSGNKSTTGGSMLVEVSLLVMMIISLFF